MEISIKNMELKDGLSGLMRTRNEAQLLEACIDSCIGSLDELIVVCSDCTDNTLEVLERKRLQYPDKLRVFEYNHKVLSFDLTQEEFEYAKTLPDDSPRLYCNLCNFGLSKVRYKYVTKIDADQLYFADELKKWRDVCSRDIQVNWHIGFIWGWLFMMYFTLYRRLSARRGKPYLWMVPDWLVKMFFKYYHEYSKWRLQQGKACIALSGLNVYSVTEKFNNPYKVMFTFPVWFHLHANRKRCWSKVKKMKDEHPECFVPIKEFPAMSYKNVYDKMDKKAHTLFQMTLFALIHKVGGGVLKKHINILK